MSCLLRNFCISINIPAERLDSNERLFRTEHFPVAGKKEKMDLSDLCFLFAAMERLEMLETAAQAVLPLLETDLLCELRECLWLSRTRVLPTE